MKQDERVLPGVQTGVDRLHHCMGIDIGSTTAKVVLLDGAGRVAYCAYRRHHAETLATLRSILGEARQALGDVDCSVLITGSAGLGVSERFGLPFIQEVVASAEVVHRRYPQVRTLIDIGGEDAKMIFFKDGCMPDIRMNGSCAGGTGAFIDQMAALLNVPIDELNDLALAAGTVYPMASRCGVFAKTDVQNLISREIERTDIAASIFNAVVYQTLATLARGFTPAPQVLFSGGPLTFLPALRRAFMQALQLDEGDVLEVEHAELLPAMGAALSGVGRQSFSLDGLLAVLAGGVGEQELKNRLEALFSTPAEFEDWERRRAGNRVGRVDLVQLAGKNCFLGIDSGSTTTKLVVVDELGRVAFTHYGSNSGNAIQAVRQGLERLGEALAGCAVPPDIARSAVTGYGEDLIRAAFGCDEGLVETLAHFRAARAFDPRVSFILDIGGQDMKAIFIENGRIQNIEINEACSSGCGSFIETFARSMGHTVGDFARKACDSQAPCDLGTRCTVFMNSRVKQALREGAAVGDISAGLAYSVIKNALHKVLKITDTAVLGDHILVQGGTFRNPAVHKAIERLLERPVVCPDIAELMGAYGAALTALDHFRAGGLRSASSFVGLGQAASAGEYARKQLYCHGCENHCTITRLTFPNGNIFYTGNRCEKIFSNAGKRGEKGKNLLAIKGQLLFDRPTQAEGERCLTIGIPRVLNLYEKYPFWNALLRGCGFEVRLSDGSSNALYESGAATIMSENICFPAKLAHGHILNLVAAGVERILYPLVIYERGEFKDATNSYNCPIVSGYPEVMRSAIDPHSQYHIPLDRPVVTFHDERLLRQGCYAYLSSLGVSRKVFARAFKQALEAQQAYKEAVRAAGQALLDEARRDGRKVVLLMSRPYHVDPLINHKIPDILADFGVDVITEDAIPYEAGAALNDRHIVTQWQYPNRYYYAARWAGEQENVEVVQLNSFGCGPDVIAMDEVKSILRQYGKGHTVIRIDEIESTGSARLRLRSMVEAWTGGEKRPATFSPRQTTRLYQKSDRRKTIIVPEFSRFCTAPIARPLADQGYRVEILPSPQRSSVDEGLKYVHNEICYPAIVVVGDVLRALKSGRYDPNEVVVGISQTGGQCRATCYISLLKKAMVANGFADIPVVSVSSGFVPLNEQPGFSLNYLKLAPRIFTSLLYADSLSAMYYASAVRERVAGTALQAAEYYMAMLEDGRLALDRKSVLRTLRCAVDDFNQLGLHEGAFPKVGVVGEIYVKYNSFGNNFAVDWLTSQGIEIVMPPLLEFFTSSFLCQEANVNAHVAHHDLLWMLSRTLKGMVARAKSEVDGVMERFRYYTPGHTIDQIARHAQEFVDLTNQFGEGWLIPGEIGSLVEQGVNNVLCLQPFGCLANHVIAKGIEKRLKETFPQLNILFLDSDAGVSEVNFYNRLYFFVNHVHTAENLRS